MATSLCSMCAGDREEFSESQRANFTLVIIWVCQLSFPVCHSHLHSWNCVIYAGYVVRKSGFCVFISEAMPERNYKKYTYRTIFTLFRHLLLRRSGSLSIPHSTSPLRERHWNKRIWRRLPVRCKPSAMSANRMVVHDALVKWTSPFKNVHLLLRGVPKRSTMSSKVTHPWLCLF